MEHHFCGGEESCTTIASRAGEGEGGARAPSPQKRTAASSGCEQGDAKTDQTIPRYLSRITHSSSRRPGATSQVSVAVECTCEQGCRVMPRWICAEMDYAHTERTLRFASGSSNVINAAVTAENQSHFPLREMGEAGLRQRKFPRPTDATVWSNIPQECTAKLHNRTRTRPRLPGRSSRGCIGKLNLNNRLSHYFPRAPERLQPAKALSMPARALPNPGVTAAAGREAVPSASVRRCEQCLSLKER